MAKNISFPRLETDILSVILKSESRAMQNSGILEMDSLELDLVSGGIPRGIVFGMEWAANKALDYVWGNYGNQIMGYGESAMESYGSMYIESGGLMAYGY